MLNNLKKVKRGSFFMMGYTHAAVGAVAGASIGQMAGSPWLGGIIGALAALAPDIDHPGSLMGSRFRVISVLLEFFAGHRTVTHTVWFCFVVGLLAGFIGRMAAVTFGLYVNPLLLFGIAFLGSVTHLALDALTLSGVKPFAPLWDVAIRGHVRTGNFIAELSIIVLCLCGFKAIF
jgi:inner membrane protein